MALIKCHECGNEVSDKAASCPNCGCPIEEIKKNLNTIKEKDCDNRINKILYEKSIKEKVIESPDISVLIDEKSIESDSRNHNKKAKILIISIIFVMIFGLILGFIINDRSNSKNNVGMFGSYKVENYEAMSDQQKINIITQFLGQEIDVNSSVTMSPELLSFMEHAKLFDYYGVCVSGYSSNNTQGKVVLDIVDWISEDQYNDVMFENTIEQLTNIYGKTTVDENASDEFYGEYVWRDTDEFSFIICGKNLDDKVDIRWIIDIESLDTKNNKQSSSEEIKLYTEYEGDFDEEANIYETSAEECFLKEFESLKQSYVEYGGTLGVNADSDWFLSASFAHDNNYYFCYSYAYGKGGSRGHILIKYDIELKQASEETPLEWIDADIKASEAEIDN